MLEGPIASVDEMAERTRARLNEHRANGGKDTEFASALVNEFVAAAANNALGAGAIYMPISLYRIVHLREEIWELKDAVAMRDDALNILFDIRDLPCQEENP
jgi:hypothetical protein